MYIRGPETESKCHARVRRTATTTILTYIRFVDSLQDRIKFLETQLSVNALKTEGSSGLHIRRSSDQDRDHSAAAALSSLARVPTPTVAPFSDAPFPSPGRGQTPLPIMASTPGDGNGDETYEWDEGGDEKELGTDAMGAASTRDYKPGFFGLIFSSRNPNVRRFLNFILHGRN